MCVLLPLLSQNLIHHFPFEIDVILLLYFLLLTSAGKQVCNVQLMEGDTIVMGSDGLFDNVFDHEIVQTIVKHKDVAETGMNS